MKKFKTTTVEQEEMDVGDDEKEESEILKAFAEYSKELTAKHDKYERIVKISRDITIESKRLIFALHARLRSNDYNKPLKKIEDDIQNIKKHFKKITLELVGEDPYQFLPAFSPGLEEFIEAVTMYKFMTSTSLLNLQQLRDLLTHELTDNAEIGSAGDQQIIKTCVPVIQYMLGVQDLTGELMRLCITSLAVSKMDLAMSALNFVQELFRAMTQISCYHREFPKKFAVTRQSLLKMEHAIFTIKIRGSEMPSHMIESMISTNISEPYFD